MNPERIISLPGVPGVPVEVTEVCPSTNDVLKARAGALPAPYVLIARRQTGGKGRLGRSFFSPEGTGLYMSVLLRPQLPVSGLTLLTPAAAVAVAEALEEVFGVESGIKWVNDVYVRDKKVCGILVESTVSPSGVSHAVVGIGVNIAPPPGGFPVDIPSAGAVVDRAAPGAVEELAAAILRRYLSMVPELSSLDFIGAYRARLMYVGREIELIRGDERRSAVLLGCDERGGLLVRLPDGSEETVTGGEITLRPKGAM